MSGIIHQHAIDLVHVPIYNSTSSTIDSNNSSTCANRIQFLMFLEEDKC